MNISALLVVVPPVQTESMSSRLAGFPDLTVHHTDATTGRILVTQEAPTIDAEVDGLRRIKSLSGVILAEMVEHHFDPHPAEAVGVPSFLQS